MDRSRRHLVRRTTAVVITALVVAVIVIAWLVVGPPAGPIPHWVRWRLPHDISTMKVSSGSRYALASYADRSVVLDLGSGRSSFYEGGVGALNSDRTFITDAGVSGYVDHGVAEAHDRAGKLLWRRALTAFDKPELIASSDRTAVIDDRCSTGKQRVVGIDLRTGRTSWQQTLPNCRWHVYGLPGHTLISVPAGRSSDRRTLTAIDGFRSFATVTGDDWTVRDDLLLQADRHGRVTATGYPRRTVRWTHRICPDTSARTRISSPGETDATTAVEAVCGDSSTRIIDPATGRSSRLSKPLGDTLVRFSGSGVIGVERRQDRIVGTDARTGKVLWQHASPAGDVHLDATSDYALVTANHLSHNTFLVLDLATGQQRAHSPSWGDWWAGVAGSAGIWVTHRALCQQPYDCKLHTTYLID